MVRVLVAVKNGIGPFEYMLFGRLAEITASLLLAGTGLGVSRVCPVIDWVRAAGAGEGGIR